MNTSAGYAAGCRDALRAVLAAIDAGDLIATPEQVAFLDGSVSALGAVLGEPAPSQSLDSETASGPNT